MLLTCGNGPSVLRELVTTARPGQWTKNALVAAAPLAAGRLDESTIALHTALAFAAFCLASSAVYCLNDAYDAAADRHHPRKQLRPVASGALSQRAALLAAIILAAGAVAISTPSDLRLVIAIYLGLNLAYTLGLKHQPVIEFCLVASGFLLRAIGGGAASGVPLSQWFLIVAAFGSLFIVAGKRLSELIQQDDRAAITRPILAQYSPSYLRMITVFSAGVTITAYSLWAFEVGAPRTGFPWATLSIAPMVIAILRYTLDVDAGRAQEPEQIVMKDRAIQLLGVCWLVIFVIAVHGG